MTDLSAVIDNPDLRISNDASADHDAPGVKSKSADELLAKAPEAVASLRELAAFHLLYGQLENADRFLRVALWIDPNDGRSQRLSAHALARLGHPVEAAKLMISAAKSQDVSLSLGDWKEVGLALIKTKHLSLGRQFLSKKQ